MNTPKTLQECHDFLDDMLEAGTKRYLKEAPISFHMNLGMVIRNEWGLWTKGPLGDYFHEMGLELPDDMSGILLDSYAHYLNNTQFNLQAEINRCKEYWEKNS